MFVWFCLTLIFLFSGRATQTNSGFNGEHWTVTPLELTNFYYQAMLMRDPVQPRPDYALTFQKNQPTFPFPDQFFWTRRVPCSGCGVDFLLNADIALGVDLKGFIDPKNGNVTCALNGSGNPTKKPTCPVASKTLSIASQFAVNSPQWMTMFRQSLLQMSNVGYRITTGCGQTICALQAV